MTSTKPTLKGELKGAAEDDVSAERLCPPPPPGWSTGGIRYHDRMKRTGFALLLAAAGISMTLTGIFGARFWQELSSWLMIVVALGVVGLVLVWMESIRRARGEDTSTEPIQPS